MRHEQQAKNVSSILIVEDSPTQAQQLQHLLEEHGYKVTAAANGKAALAVLGEWEPSIIISDIIMPEMDGFALCKEIKSRKKLEDIPVVLLTSLSRPQDVIQGLQCGADNFIRKPYEEKYLLSRIDHLVTNRELRKTEKIQVGLKIRFQGHEYLITSERRQVLDLLISTFEEAIRLNGELYGREQEMKAANERLEREVADRKRAEEETRKLNSELAAANQELEAFSYSVAHDLRAPLRAIDGFSRIFLDKHAFELPPDAQRYLNLVRDHARQMGRLIDDLLAFARLSRQPLKRQRVAPAEIVRQALTDLQQEQAGRKIEISLADLPACEADPSLLKQVFVNLLSNALKYSRQREVSRIEIGWQQTDGSPVYFVKDNGVGFDMQYADKLFGVFQRLHRAEEYEGTGVGLAIAQRIIHRHGGHIRAHAEIDKGATFYFTLGGSSSHG